MYDQYFYFCSVFCNFVKKSIPFLRNCAPLKIWWWRHLLFGSWTWDKAFTFSGRSCAANVDSCWSNALNNSPDLEWTKTVVGALGFPFPLDKVSLLGQWWNGVHKSCMQQCSYCNKILIITFQIFVCLAYMTMLMKKASFAIIAISLLLLSLAKPRNRSYSKSNFNWLSCKTCRLPSHFPEQEHWVPLQLNVKDSE